MNPKNEEYRRHVRVGLGVLLVAFLTAFATTAVGLGAGGEEALPLLAAPLDATSGTEPLHAANKKAGKKSSALLPRSKSSGETEATKRGRQAHKDWDPGEGFRKEVRLPSGKRADAVNLDKQEVKELKPDTPRAIKRGERQVEEYRRELEGTEGGSWTGKVETYKPDAGEKD
ncbi:hypothetical protein ACN28I_35515 [Archangium gephyra]|uniref:hypothetical protein n=1 Tax=Archangium gephyra TaxID=48 RepID=UPI003B77A570